MIVGIDGNEANIEKKVGVHQMTLEFLWALYRLEDNGVSYIIYLKDKPRADLPPETERWKYKVIPGRRLWVITKLSVELLFNRHIDVFLTPSHYLPLAPWIPLVCVITDLGYLKFSGQFRKFDYWQLRVWTAISIIISKRIIAISKSTEKDIVRHYPFASKKIKVAYLSANSSSINFKKDKKFVRQILKKYRITKKFIIFISTLKPGKNVEGLIDAFAKLKFRDNYQLVIVGKKGWMYDSIFRKVTELGIADKVIFTDYLPEEEKYALLSAARALALPSFWEGFGIDVLNSFSLGVPVVVSRVASLPEVAGPAGIYVNPYDSKSIAKGLQKVLEMDRYEYNKRVEMGFRQLSKFSWQKSAKTILNILKGATK
jgi:glycosyltransferase involved in cell wall biosynthesis